MNLAEMASVIYLVDTNSWIKIQDMAVPEQRREMLWERIESLVIAGRIRTVQVVIEEAERNSAPTYEYLKALKEHADFEIRKREQLANAEERHILRSVEQKSRSLARNTRGREKADAYLIAAAEARGFTVVSEEGNRRGQIPDVCRQRDVTCMSLLELVVSEGLA